MPEVIEQFLTLPMIVFCLVIWALVFVQRKGIELAFPQVKDKKSWTELFVPLGPLGTGALVAAPLSMYPFPAMLAGHWTGRAAIGLVCGMASGLVYRIFKKVLVEKLGTKAAEATGTPSSDTPMP